MAATPGILDAFRRGGDEMSSTDTGTQTAVGRWTVDRERTIVEFEVEHLWGLHSVRGRFRSFDGACVIGRDGAEIELTIDAASVDTGNGVRDKHLRSDDFLNVAEHPQLRFRSSYVTRLEPGRAHVSGDLDVAGTTIPLAFDGSVRLVDDELECEATATLDQGRFGMSRGPLHNIQSPTTVHVKGRLVRAPEQASTGSM
jgi:polyisoprenoid-binding protein YceI